MNLFTEIEKTLIFFVNVLVVLVASVILGAIGIFVDPYFGLGTFLTVLIFGLIGTIKTHFSSAPPSSPLHQ